MRNIIGGWVKQTVDVTTKSGKTKKMSIVTQRGGVPVGIGKFNFEQDKNGRILVKYNGDIHISKELLNRIQ